MRLGLFLGLNSRVTAYFSVSLGDAYNSNIELTGFLYWVK